MFNAIVLAKLAMSTTLKIFLESFSKTGNIGAQLANEVGSNSKRFNRSTNPSVAALGFLSLNLPMISWN